MVDKQTVLVYASPIGSLHIAAFDGAIVHLGFSPISGTPGILPVLERCALQLDEYFAGTRQVFDLPLAPAGTVFQQKVWTVLQTIPYGMTWTYKDLAEAAGCPRGYRAVGLANNRNPISIIIPCHRVIGANGKLTGYGGGLANKAYLLKREGICF